MIICLPSCISRKSIATIKQERRNSSIARLMLLIPECALSIIKATGCWEERLVSSIVRAILLFRHLVEIPQRRRRSFKNAVGGAWLLFRLAIQFIAGMSTYKNARWRLLMDCSCIHWL